LWAFGCVLFEMLSGVRAFDGEDATDTIAAVVRGEPHWQALPADLPPAVRLLLQRCLEKDRRKRVGDAAAALFVLGEPTLMAAAPPPSPVVVEPRRSPWRTVAWPVLGVRCGGLVAGGAVWMIRQPDPPQLSRLAITTWGAALLGRSIQALHLATTPDGSTVIYVGAPVGRAPALFARRLDSLSVEPLAQNAASPFVRPDGESVGYVSQGTLRRVAITGGPSVEVTRVDGPVRGATWGDDDTIVFATAGTWFATRSGSRR
jgi:serine/threonine-protein kinase